MFEQFINFILETNIFASISLCIAFVIFSVGSLAPIINIIGSYIWSFIDETESEYGDWFIKKATSFIPSKCEWKVTKKSCGYHVTNGKKYHYKSGSNTQTMTDRDTRFSYMAPAQKWADELNGKSGIGVYILHLIVIIGIFVFASILFNYFMWPTIYIISCVGFMFALRLLRRVQKKATEMVTKFKEHTEQSADVAHKSED